MCFNWNPQWGHTKSFQTLKEKLPQTFLQSWWMEKILKSNSKSLGKFGYNPIKSFNLSKFRLISCMPPSRVALCYNLWCHKFITVQLSDGNVHKFLQNSTFHENKSSFYFYDCACIFYWTWSTGQLISKKKN